MEGQSSMDINKLRTFLTIAQYGSFRAAAENLFLSPRAVSKQMDQIENELGVKLFTRQKNNTSLTDMGQEFIVTATDLVNSYTNAYNRIQIENASNSRKVVIGFSSQNQSTIIQQTFREPLLQNPEIELELREESGRALVKMVREKQLHMAVTPAYDEVLDYGPKVGVRKLITGEMVVGVSRQNPVSKLESVNLEQLSELPVFYYNSYQSTYLKEVFYKKFNNIFPKKNIQRCSSIEQRDMLIALDRGIGFFPQPLVPAESMLNPMIKFLKIENDLNTYYASVLLYNKEVESPTVRKLIDQFEWVCA